MSLYDAFTLKGNGVLYRLTTNVLVSSNVRDTSIPINESKKWCGLWDTGATGTFVD